MASDRITHSPGRMGKEGVMINEEASVVSAPGIRLTRQQRDAADKFFRESYRQLLTFAMYLGATREEADDAVESVMIDMLARWGMTRDPLAYARARISHDLIKQRTRARRFVPFPDEDGEYLGGRDRDRSQEEQL